MISLQKIYKETPLKKFRMRGKLPNHKSALKRMRQNEKRRLRNKAIKSRTKTAIKKVLKAIEEKNIEQAEQLFIEATKIIYKAKSKGVYHKRNAARKVSRLALRLNKAKGSLESSVS